MGNTLWRERGLSPLSPAEMLSPLSPGESFGEFWRKRQNKNKCAQSTWVPWHSPAWRDYHHLHPCRHDGKQQRAKEQFKGKISSACVCSTRYSSYMCLYPPLLSPSQLELGEELSRNCLEISSVYFTSSFFTPVASNNNSSPELLSLSLSVSACCQELWNEQRGEGATTLTFMYVLPLTWQMRGPCIPWHKDIVNLFNFFHFHTDIHRASSPYISHKHSLLGPYQG